MIDRRLFLESALGGLTAAITSPMALAAGDPIVTDQQLLERPDTLFLTWQRDPTTTMTVQWIEAASGLKNQSIQYTVYKKDQWKSLLPQDRPYPRTDLRVFRAEIVGLEPGTNYQFRIGNRSTVYRFRTMPAKATNAFHFVSGGDCGVNPHALANNVIAAKQDPMFALIGGDLGYDNGRDVATSLQFVRNYSSTMVDSHGRLIPIVVCMGNHEVNGGYNRARSDGPFFFALHGGLYRERTFATLDFGDYLSLVLLDSGHVAPIGGEQADWLDKSLAERTDRPHLIVANHVPAYPSYRSTDNDTGKPGTGSENRTHWVPLFERHNVDLVLEHHDHTFKRTHPLRGGHVDHKNGILYMGDGSWGRLRAPKKPDKRSYLAATHQSYHLTLHRLEGEQRFHMAINDVGKIVDVCMTQKKPRQLIK
jgi:acid phosphatase type 7